jgi:hypothetical protein
MHHKEHEMSCKATKMPKSMKNKNKKTGSMKHSKEDLKEAAKHMEKHKR